MVYIMLEIFGIVLVCGVGLLYYCLCWPILLLPAVSASGAPGDDNIVWIYLYIIVVSVLPLAFLIFLIWKIVS